MDANEQRRRAQQNQDYAARKAAEEQARQRQAEAYWDKVHREREEVHREIVNNDARMRANNLAIDANRALERSANEGTTRSFVSLETNDSSSGWSEADKIAANVVAENLRQQGYKVNVDEKHGSRSGGGGNHMTPSYNIETTTYRLYINSDPDDTWPDK